MSLRKHAAGDESSRCGCWLLEPAANACPRMSLPDDLFAAPVADDPDLDAALEGGDGVHATQRAETRSR